MRVMVLVCCEFFSEMNQNPNSELNLGNSNRQILNSVKTDNTFTTLINYNFVYFEQISRNFANLGHLKSYYTGGYQDLDEILPESPLIRNTTGGLFSNTQNDQTLSPSKKDSAVKNISLFDPNNKNLKKNGNPRKSLRPQANEIKIIQDSVNAPAKPSKLKKGGSNTQNKLKNQKNK